MKSVIKRLVGVAITLLVTSAAEAQDVRAVSPIQVEMGGWHYVPTLRDDRVETILALRVSEPIGQNLSAVWYRPTAGGGWASFSWTTQSREKIIASVKATLGLSDQDDALWPTPSADVISEAPQMLVCGVMDNDPFAQILSQVNPSTAATLLRALEDAGWQAASIAPDLGACGGESLDVQLLASCIDANLTSEESTAGALYAAVVAATCTPPSGPPPECIRSVTTGAWGTIRWNVSWTVGAPTLIPAGGSSCKIRNHYTATAIATQCRKLSVTCRDCSVITRSQCKTWMITWGLAQDETTPASVTPCAIPPAYVPPATPTSPNVPPANYDGPFNEAGPVPDESSICP